MMMPKEKALSHCWCYRRLCHELVEYFIDCFRNTVNEEEVKLVLKEEKRRVIFIEEGNAFHHNHSILDSRKVWEAYIKALEIIKTEKQEIQTS